jgi:hypothetical protein
MNRQLDVSLTTGLGEIMSNGLRPFHKPPNRTLAERTAKADHISICSCFYMAIKRTTKMFSAEGSTTYLQWHV